MLVACIQRLCQVRLYEMFVGVHFGSGAANAVRATNA